MSKELTKEQLMKPRYKVIADWPDMLETIEIGNVVFGPALYVTEQCKVRLEEYPHLFKPLEWWEERTQQEMSRYLKRDMENYGGILEGEPEIYVVSEHFKLAGRPGFDHSKYQFISANGQASDYGYGAFLPATEEEYNAYLSSTTIKDKDNG